MNWNYRIIRTNERGLGELFSLHEVFYDDSDQPTSRTTDPIDFGSYESPDELRKAITLAAADAVNRDVLDDSEIGKGDR